MILLGPEYTRGSEISVKNNTYLVCNEKVGDQVIRIDRYSNTQEWKTMVNCVKIYWRVQEKKVPRSL